MILLDNEDGYVMGIFCVLLGKPVTSVTMFIINGLTGYTTVTKPAMPVTLLVINDLTGYINVKVAT